MCGGGRRVRACFRKKNQKTEQLQIFSCVSVMSPRMDGWCGSWGSPICPTPWFSGLRTLMLDRSRRLCVLLLHSVCLHRPLRHCNGWERSASGCYAGTPTRLVGHWRQAEVLMHAKEFVALSEANRPCCSNSAHSAPPSYCIQSPSTTCRSAGICSSIFSLLFYIKARWNVSS